MGTTTSFYWQSRSDVVKERIQRSCYVNSAGRQITHMCLKHSVRGSVLWTVWERVIIDLNTSDCFVDRFIGCDLIRCYGRGDLREWGYKDMCESMGPYYYDCPLSYLEMAPVANEEWREGVRRWHAEQAKKRKFQPTKGQILELSGCFLKAVEYVAKVSKTTHEVLDRNGNRFSARSKYFTGKVLPDWPQEA